MPLPPATVQKYMPLREAYLEIIIFEALLNGIYTALFAVTIYAMIFRRRQNRLRNPGLYVAVVAMYILSTIHVGCRWYLVKQAFIDHGQSPESTLAFILVNPAWLVITPAAALVTNTFIADCILIWRCWTVWGKSLWAIILPGLCTIGGTALGYVSVSEQARYVLNPTLDRSKFVDFATPYFSLTLVTTVICTLLIVARILLVTRSTAIALNPSGEVVNRKYSKAIEIIVESAVLYSITLIVFLPLMVQGSSKNAWPQTVLTQMTGFAPTLILARVSFGLSRSAEGWTRRTKSSGTASSVVFDSDKLPVTTEISTTGSRMTRPETPSSAGVSPVDSERTALGRPMFGFGSSASGLEKIDV
ncbi:hypothetical protein MKEN_00130800 [Mycena kentingensis (nom. inval.)]|nr:hypothetical protein MKEN_00130800 [Mycena kentingensis (nom. inval.)]